MRIKKVLNNNAVTVLKDNEEIVVMGLGLAFKKRAGDLLEEDKIERVFTLQNKEASERLKYLISEIPIEFFKVSEIIIKMAEEKLSKKLNDSIYLTLTDHINFAVTRYKEGLDIKNPLIWDIKRFYKEEFKIGLEAIKIINEKLKVKIDQDDAGSIALHIVNAQLNVIMPEIMDITNIIQEILSIITSYFNIILDEDTLDYYRLVTHLKFFAQRLLRKKNIKKEDDYLFHIVKEKYSKAYECVLKIEKYIFSKYNVNITKEEMTYLIVHIQRVVYRNINE